MVAQRRARVYALLRGGVGGRGLHCGSGTRLCSKGRCRRVQACRVAPVPQQLRHLIHTLLFQCREHAHFTTARIEFGDGQNLGLLGARQLVGFGEQDQKLQATFYARANSVQQRFIQLRQTQAGVAQQHHGAQAFALHQVVEHHPLPALFVRARYCGIAIAGQVSQHRIGGALFAQRKQVDVLGAARFFGSKGQLLLLR